MITVKHVMLRLLMAAGLEEAVRESLDFLRHPQVACRNIGYRLAGAGDGLPVPPSSMIFRATISREVSWFLHSGRVCHDCICEVLENNAIRIADLKAILDFGCGCGRVTRHWKPAAGTRLFGTDCDARAIAWCRKKLGRLAQFSTNDAEPPLRYESATFDLVYSVSVFTHLPEDLQLRWITELRRVLRDRGFLLLTLHGCSRRRELTPEERARFDSGQLVIKALGVQGSNLFGAYHPKPYVLGRLAAGFETVDFVPAGARDANQDIYLLQRPAA